MARPRASTSALVSPAPEVTTPKTDAAAAAKYASCSVGVVELEVHLIQQLGHGVLGGERLAGGSVTGPVAPSR